MYVEGGRGANECEKPGAQRMIQDSCRPNVNGGHEGQHVWCCVVTALHVSAEWPDPRAHSRRPSS
jgi:hypothetical protein